ncbi:MAG TPA: ABC transporter substrate-binding protein [Stellaceae bacterium]|nr:ABC transporter substrate-binding protein [Stellaceae bacterium]
MLAGMPALAADKITTGFVGAPTANGWPWFVGMAKGFFAAAGIEIDPIYAPSAPGNIQQVSAGSLDLVSGSGLTDPLYAIEKGAPIAIARIVSLANPYAMVAQKSIHSIRELKGKTIVIGGLADITRVYFDRMVEGNGLKQGEYDITVIGATPGRYAALRSGAADAALLIPPILFKAEHEGFNNIGRAYDYTKDLPFGGMIVNRNWAAQHRDAMQRLMPAYAKSLDWFLDDKNRAEAIAILQKAGNLQEQEVAESWDFTRKIPAFETTGKVSKRLLGNLMTVLIKMGQLQAPIPMDKIALQGVTQIGD